jgi:ATP-binding cassette subfamily B protein
MHILFSYLRRQKRPLALALVLAAINQIFSLLDPLIFRHIIDRYATRYDEPATSSAASACCWRLPSESR